MSLMRGTCVRAARRVYATLPWVLLGILTAAYRSVEACVSNASLPATGVLLAGCSGTTSYRFLASRLLMYTVLRWIGYPQKKLKRLHTVFTRRDVAARLRDTA